nr:hypothetical protein [Gammaproteobacteria bacterium]
MAGGSRGVSRYVAPSDVRFALEALFGKAAVDRIEVVYRPLYVRCHLAVIGARHGSVTRPWRIYTSLSPGEFYARDMHVLHEYYHVVQQWGTQRMTRLGYLARWRRREREAVTFAREHVERYRRLRAAACRLGERRHEPAVEDPRDDVSDRRDHERERDRV